MCNSSAPNPPDPTTIANASTKSNEDTAAFQTGLNAVNQVGPNGSLTYTSTPGKNGAPPQYTATTSYSPAVQKIMDALQQGQQSIANTGATQAAGLGKSLTSVAAPSYTQFGAAPTLNTTGGNAGGVQSAIAGAGSLANNYNNGGAVNGTIAGAGPLATGYNNGGTVNGTIAGAGPLASGYSLGGTIQKSLGGSGNISADTQKYEDTLFGQLDTQSGKDQATLASQLAQEGIARGSDAYTRAMDDFQKSKSADRTNAILNAGNFGQQEQNMALNAGNFANSAQGQQTAENAALAAFGNNAQSQQFGENAAQANFGNSAQAQRNAQNALAAAFGNNSQGQQFGENTTSANFGNSAQAQRNAQNAGAAAFGNNAQGQQFNENTTSANFGNSAQAQKFAQALQNAGFSNEAIQQMFGNRNAVTGANNSLKTQGLQDSVTANNQNINQTLALENGSPVQQPNFQSTPQTGVNPTNVAGIAQNGYDQQMAAYNSNQQQLGGIFGSLGTLGATLAPYLFSDRRMKENIRPIGKTNDGQKIYEFNYKGSPTTTMGLMAQDVMKKHPSAVAKIGGLYGVNYKEALRAA